MEPQKDYSSIYLETLLCALQLQANLDELQGTSVYRHKFKQATKALCIELDKIIKKMLGKFGDLMTKHFTLILITKRNSFKI